MMNSTMWQAVLAMQVMEEWLLLWDMSALIFTDVAIAKNHLLDLMI